jgi:protein MAK11
MTEDNFKLLVSLGTYEKVVYGVDFKSADGKIEKKVAFSIPAHIGYVKAITSGPQFLVSGSTDETIRIFDLRRRKDFGSLTSHTGSITCLTFFKQNMLLSGGEDGKIVLTRCADWEVLQVLRGHKGGVFSVAIHPSGKLALSIGKDRHLKTWNIVTGKIALKIPLPAPCGRIFWSPQGSYYALISERSLQVYQTDGASLALDFNPERRLYFGLFISDSKVLVGGEGSQMSCYSIEDKTWTTIQTNHTPRIKDAATCTFNGMVFVVTGSSDGKIIVWRYTDSNLNQIASHESKLRITCISITPQ